MTNFFRAIGHFTIEFIRGLGATALFLLNILLRSADSVKRPRLTIRQLYFSGVMSILIVAVSGLFMGMVLGLQVYNILVQFKAADVLGFAVAASLLREIGPVLAALLFASSAGSAMTSEIGLMKTTEQLEAMNVMAVNPVARVVAPRFWAGVISMPLLAAICDVSGIYGAYLIGVKHLGLDAGIFWSQMQAGVDWHYDVLNSIIKSFVFGIAIALIAVFQGFHAHATAEGILRATTRTVVISSLAILALDFVLTAFMFIG
ncbi:MAG: lipid asymmetry maintenance ABC transporter permease subunit MlaE [Neisseriaceae bacterium]|nr:lipid asymmetry maintenance ABC transporter permease subunit MlaE [Neisseriaceae bacterium]